MTRTLPLPLLILLTLSYLTSLHAQSPTQTLRGQVMDSETGFALPGATVKVQESNLGTLTDSVGFFTLKEVPVGRQTVQVTYTGYRTELLKEAEVSSGKELFLEFKMVEEGTSLDTVTITVRAEQPLNSMAVVSARSFDLWDVNRTAGSLTDPLRMAQSLPGVAVTNDDANDLAIRGNSPRGMLWRLEGIEIPNPNHFKSGDGSTGGGITLFSSNVLQRSDVLTGAFPAEYGNALSGVFDMRLRNGNTQKHEQAFQLGVLGIEAGLEGPINRKKGSSYLVNYRYSTLQLLNVIGVVNDEEEAVPNYQDLTLKLHFPTRKLGVFSLFAVGGMSDAKEPSGLDSVDVPVQGLDYWDFRNQRMGVAGVSNRYFFKNNRTSLHTVASLQFLRLTNNIAYQDTNTGAFVTDYQEEMNYPTGRLSVKVNHKVNAANVIRAGVIWSQMGYNIQVSDREDPGGNFVIQQAEQGFTPFLQGYGQWKHRFGNKMESILGVHTAWLQINQQVVAEPRLGLKYQPNSRHIFSAGVGLHSRLDPLSVYALSFPSPGPEAHPNDKLGFQKALHNVLGWSWFPGKNLRLTVEAYYQHLYDVPVGIDSLSYFSTLNIQGGYLGIPLENTGTGYNYGLEMTFERRFVSRYYFLFSGTAFNSRYAGLDNIERQTAYNYGFIANGAGGKEFLVGKRKANTISLFLRGVMRGGTPLVPIDVDASTLAGKTVYEVQAGYADRTPMYNRLDFGFWFRINKPNRAWILSLDVQNVMNTQNIKNYIFDPQTGQVESVNQLGIVPILNVKVLL